MYIKKDEDEEEGEGEGEKEREKMIIRSSLYRDDRTQRWDLKYALTYWSLDCIGRYACIHRAHTHLSLLILSRGVGVANE